MHACYRERTKTNNTKIQEKERKEKTKKEDQKNSTQQSIRTGAHACPHTVDMQQARLLSCRAELNRIAAGVPERIPPRALSGQAPAMVHWLHRHPHP